MRLKHPDGGELYLAYCSNVHPAEDLAGIVAQLERYAAGVRERLGVERLGVGLWLSHLALDDKEAGPRLREALDRLGLEVVTLNGFPYRAFHAPVVKREVYRPSWADPRRRHYTIGLARLLAQMLPDDVTEGSISTVPLGWREGWSESAESASRDALALVADSLRRLEQETGKRIRLALEPEPGCEIETVARAGEFLVGLEPEWIGLCVDTCHLAVQFEEPGPALERLGELGVPVVKAQISNALRVAEPASAVGRELLGRFAEPRFLHQVRELHGGQVVGADDLPDALAGGLPGEDEWRVHFHVPVDSREDTTQPELESALAALVGGASPLTRHLEVETYTWSVLPDARNGNRVEGDERLVEGIARELEWTRDRLVELGMTA